MTEETRPAETLSPLSHATASYKNRRKRRPKRLRLLRKIKLIWFGYALTPIVIISVLLTVLAVDSFSQVEQAQDELDAVFNSLNDVPATDLSLQDFEQVDGALQALNSALIEARSRTRPLRLMTFASPDYAARFKLLDAAIHATTGSRYFMAGLKPTVVLLDGNPVFNNSLTGDPTGERTVELLTAGRNQFLLANKEIALARQEIQNIDLDGVSPSILLDIETLEDYLTEIETYNQIALEAPNLLTLALGLQNNQTYIILGQNSDEIRPSGGYVSTWGWMRIRSGRVYEYDYNATTASSPNPPPGTLASLLDIPDWWFQFQNPIYTAWDGSWYADFSDTAEMASWFYSNGSNPHAPADGVIGIDLVAVEYIVEALGEVHIPEYNQTITISNLRDVIYSIRREAAEGNTDSALEHKEFVAAVYQQIITDWQNAGPIVKSQVNRAFLKALQEKHIMIYFADTELQKAIDTLGWAGSQNQGTGYDYLMVADANIGSKSSRSVERQITYDVVIQADDNSVQSRLSILYNFSAIVAEADPAVQPPHYSSLDYYTLTQILTPPNSEQISASNIQNLQNGSTDTSSIFVGYINVPFDETTRVQLQYKIPNVVQNVGSFQRYRLLIEKQPGTLSDSVAVTVTLPPGSTVVAVDPSPSATYQLGQPVLEFRLDLRTDTWIEVTYQ